MLRGCFKVVLDRPRLPGPLDGDRIGRADRVLHHLAVNVDKFASSDPVKCDEVDMEFHLHIVRATRFPRLYELIENSKIETAMLFGIHLGHRLMVGKRKMEYHKLIGNHKPVVKALLAKDPEAAQQAIIQHVDSALVLLMKFEEAERASAQMRDASRASIVSRFEGLHALRGASRKIS